MKNVVANRSIDNEPSLFVKTIKVCRDEYRRDMANSVKGVRDRFGITQKGLAWILGTDPSVVSKWERGLNLPMGPFLDKLQKLEETSMAEWRLKYKDSNAW